jgi:hypothetical protein
MRLNTYDQQKYYVVKKCIFSIIKVPNNEINLHEVHVFS